MSFLEQVKNLFTAIKNNDINTVRDILTVNPDAVRLPIDDETDSYSPLWEAMLLGHAEIVRVLIDFGADVYERFTFKSGKLKWYSLTFLHGMSFFKDNWEKYEKVAEILISHGGASVNAYYNPLKKIPFELAVERGNIKCAEFLIKNGAKISVSKNFGLALIDRLQNDDSMKIVLCAPKVNQKEMLELLINTPRFNPKFHMKRLRFDCVLYILTVATLIPDGIDFAEIVKILINVGVPVNGRDNCNQSSLEFAVNLQNIELVSVLIQKGADVNAKSFQGSFPLFIAVLRSNFQIADLLLLNGANINAKTIKGLSALHIACYKRHEELTELLLQKGANLNVETDSHMTPFYYLEPHKYKQSDVSLINIMIREIAKEKFFDESAVSKKDLVLLQLHSKTREFFEKCLEELKQMANTKFYAPYSYVYILKMSKVNMKKLANLFKNTECVTGFHANIDKFSYYKSMLIKIFKEAIQVRDKTLMVESRLKYTFGESLPNVILRKLAHNLTNDDLPVS